MQPSSPGQEKLLPARIQLLKEFGNTPSPFRIKREERKGWEETRYTANQFVRAQASCSRYLWWGIWEIEGVTPGLPLSVRMGHEQEYTALNWPGPVITQGKHYSIDMAQLPRPLKEYELLLASICLAGIAKGPKKTKLAQKDPEPLLLRGDEARAPPKKSRIVGEAVETSIKVSGKVSGGKRKAPPVPVTEGVDVAKKAPPATTMKATAPEPPKQLWGPISKASQDNATYLTAIVPLTDDDDHTRRGILADRRVNITNGRDAVEKSRVDVALYALRYLATFNAAVVEHGEGHWIFYVREGGMLHLPLLCGNHFMAMRGYLRGKGKMITFQAVGKDDLKAHIPSLDPGQCHCQQIIAEGKVLPHAVAGRFFKSNVERMLEKVGNAAVEPYDYKVLQGVEPAGAEEKLPPKSP
jgi:hypothetical protein